MATSLWPLLIHHTVLHKLKLACYLMQNGRHLKSGCVPLTALENGPTVDFHGHWSRLPESWWYSSCAYVSDTHRELSESACWIDRRGGEDGDGNPCDRSWCWTLDPSHGALPESSLSTPALASARLCLDKIADDSGFPALDCLHHFPPHPCFPVTQAWIRCPSFDLAYFLLLTDYYSLGLDFWPSNSVILFWLLRYFFLFNPILLKSYFRVWLQLWSIITLPGLAWRLPWGFLAGALSFEDFLVYVSYKCIIIILSWEESYYIHSDI